MGVLEDYQNRSDEVLIENTRAGDDEAYAELYRRHNSVAKGIAIQMGARHEDAADFVAEAFASTLLKLRAGEGPDVFFRGYLLGAVRNLANRNFGRLSKVDLVSEYTGQAEQVVQDNSAARYEAEIVRNAFESLPERSRLVLWMTEVEGKKPHEITELLGIEAKAVAALAYRSRETLRQAYLQSHLQQTPRADCRKYASQLGALVRSKLPTRRSQQVQSHIRGCVYCTTALHDITEVNESLRLVVGPSIVGAAGMALFPGAAISADSAATVSSAETPAISGEQLSSDAKSGAKSMQWLGGAAALVVFLGSAAFLMLRQPSSDEDLATDHETAAASVRSATAEPGAPAELSGQEPTQTSGPGAPGLPVQPAELELPVVPVAPTQHPPVQPSTQAQRPSAEPNAFQPSGSFSRDAFDPSVLTLRIALQPAGSGPVSGVRVLVDLPAGLRYDYVDAGPLGWSCAPEGQGLSCTAANADGGGVNYLRIGLLVTHAGQASVPITVTGNGWGPNSATAVLRVP